MGMFDYIRCKMPLPDGFEFQGWFQTKDTDRQYMEHYEIREDGSLWIEEYDIEDRSNPKAAKGSLESLRGCMTRVNQRWVPAEPHHGAIEFYHSNICGSSGGGKVITDDNSEPWSAEYVALYDHGKLLKLEGKKEPRADVQRVSREEFWDNIEGMKIVNPGARKPEPTTP